MVNCRFNAGKQCVREYSDCENCKVPNSFGFFAVQKGSKLLWEQRFILERGRAARLAWIDAEIEKLRKEKAEVEALPVK